MTGDAFILHKPSSAKKRKPVVAATPEFSSDGRSTNGKPEISLVNNY
jgi:hypothetical protein